MQQLPTGTVTFLFTDIEGSSRRWDSQREAMAEALARHDALIRQAVEAHVGYVFHTAGDAFGVAFSSPDDALAGAIAAQRALAAADWSAIAPGFEPLAVRMGLHTGLAELRDGDYFGPPLNRAARLMSAGHGGQVLLSLATQQLVRDRLPAGVTLRDLGGHRLKDLRFAEHIYQLVVDGMADVATPPTTAEALPTRDRALVDADFLPVECPYRGLLAFREDDARFFFGRETFTARLARDIAGRPMVGVIGPSGSGKSSVVFAGLLPRLRGAAGGNGAGAADLGESGGSKAGGSESGRQGGGSGSVNRPGNADGTWSVLKLRPGAEPFHALAGVLVPLLEGELSETARLVETRRMAEALADGTLSVAHVIGRVHEVRPDTGRLLIIADQFEELYTLCPDERAQRAFQDLLFDAAFNGGRDASLTLALTLRADFMGHATAYRPFADAIQDHNVILGPMTGEELARAITRPAEIQGRAFESGLVERILADVGEEAGQLPLLEFALTKLWERQQSGWLTHGAYEAIGRVEGAVARHADAVYDDLPSTEQTGCRRVFVQMVRPGEGTEDTRRLATKEELGEDWPLVRRLADARLVVTNRDAVTGRQTVEVVHEALIRSWGRLKGWMNADRAFRTWQERVRFAAKQWAATGEDEGALLRGVPLAEAEIWLAERGGELAPAERAYVEASVAQQARREAEEQARAARERGLERRSHRLVRVVAAVAVVGAIVAGVLAVSARRSATEARSLAQASGAQAYLTSGDTGRALALALEAVQGANPPQAARRVLAEAAFAPGVRWEVRYPESAITDVAVSPDGRMVAAGLGWRFTGEIKAPGLVLHDLATGRLIRRFEGVLASVSSVAFSPDGHLLASMAKDGTLTLWDVATGKPFHRMVQRPNYFSDVEFIDAGKRVVVSVTASVGSQIVVWDVPTGRRLQEWAAADLFSLAATPDGRLLITGGAPSSGGGAAKVIWIWRDGKRISRLDGRSPLAIMRDGNTLAVTSPDDTRVLLYNLATGALLHTLNVEAEIGRLASSANSETLAFASGVLIRLWDVGRSTETLRLSGHRSSVGALAFTGDDKGLVSGANDGSLRLWDLGNGEETWRRQVGSAGLVRLVRKGAAVALRAETGLSLVPLSGTDPPRRTAFPADWPKGSFVSVDITADGRLAAAGFPAGAIRNIRLLDLATGHEPPHSPMEGDGGGVMGLRFTRDGTRLVGIGWNGYLWAWNVADGTRVLAVNLNTVLRKSVQLTELDLSPDDQLALVGLQDGRAVTFDIATGQRGTVLAGHTERVTAVRFSPNGHLALTGSNDQTAVLWDMDSGRALRRLEGHTGSVGTVSFSPDGRLALTASGDGTVRVWDVATGKQRQSQAITVAGVAFRPDGTGYLTVSPDGFLRSWRIDDDPTSVAHWAFSNRFIPELSCGERQRFLVAVDCDADERFPTRTPHAIDLRPTLSPAVPLPSPTIAATITGTVAAPTPVAQPAYTAQVGTNPGKLAPGIAQAWTLDAHVGTVLDVAVHAGQPADAVDAVAAQQAQGLLDTRLIIRDAHGTLVAESEDVITDRDTDAAVSNLVIPADGPLTLEVRSASDATAGPFSLDVHTVPLSTEARRLMDPDPSRLQALVSPDGETLLTLEDEPETSLRHVRLRHLSDMSVQATISITHELRPRQVYFSPDGRRLVGNVDDGSGRVLMINAATREVERVIHAHDGTSFHVSFLPGGRQLLTCGADKLIRLWDLDTGAEVRRFTGHTDTVTRANASPDGQLVVSSSRDHTVRVWDVASGQELRRYELADESRGVGGAELSPDGRVVATTVNEGRTTRIHLWSPATGTAIREMPAPYLGVIYPSPFSPDGRWLLTAVGNGLHFWDVASGREVNRLVADAPWLRARFTPDGRAVLALGIDGSVWWWDVAGIGDGGT